MRCECCNSLLTEAEIHQKHALTGAFLNTCNYCLDGLGIPVEGIDEEDDGQFIAYDELFDDDLFYNSLMDEDE